MDGDAHVTFVQDEAGVQDKAGVQDEAGVEDEAGHSEFWPPVPAP